MRLWVRGSAVVGAGIVLLLGASGAAGAARPTHGDPPMRPSPGAMWNRAAALSTADPGFDATFCGPERSTDDADAQRTVAPRFKVVYAHPSDVTDHFATVAPAIAKALHDTAQLVLGTSHDLLTLRFDTGTSCSPRSLDIASVTLPGPSSSYDGLTDAQFDSIEAAVKQTVGPVAGPHDFLVFVDGPQCLGTAGRGSTSDDDVKTVMNAANLPSDDAAARAAIVYHCGQEEYFDTSPGAYWSGAPLHEMSHNLGAVQSSAPHASGAAHCWDHVDVMCYDDGGPTIPAGAFSTPDQCAAGVYDDYDCNGDDYFNATPPAGSYLATHWNLADSVFMCAPALCYQPAAAPQAALVPDRGQVDVSGNVTLTAQASSANGPITEYRWDVDPSTPGDEVVTRSPSIQHVFSRRGANPVQVTVRDAFGQHAVAAATVTVVGRPPAVDVPSSRTVAVGRPLVVDGTATPDSGQRIVSQGFDLTGVEGGHADGATFRHVFSAPGAATLTFNVVDDAGHAVQRTTAVTVTPGPRVSASLRSRRLSTLRRRGVQVRLGTLPAGRVDVRVQVGRLVHGRLRSSQTRTSHLTTSADTARSLTVRLTRAGRRALSRSGAAVRVRITTPGLQIAPRQVTTRVKR